MALVLQHSIEQSPDSLTPRGRPLKWLAAGVASLSILALILLILESFGRPVIPQGQASLLALILAATVTLTGILLLIWALVSTARRTRTNHAGAYGAMNTTARTNTQAVRSTHDRATELSDVNLTELTRTLTGAGYWATDADGTYERLEPAYADNQLRLKEHLGNHRLRLAADTASAEAVASIERLIEAGKPFRQTLWRSRLPSGQIITVRESGMPRYDEKGRFSGYHGFIEDISAQALDPVRTQLVTQALDVLPMPLALLHRPAQSDHPGDWQLVWANAPMSDLTGRSQVELTEMRPQQWLLCAPTAEGDDGLMARANRKRTGPLLTHLLDQNHTHQGNGLVINRYGRRRSVLLTLERIDAEQASNRLVLVAADVSAPALKTLQARTAQVDQAESEAAKRALEIEITARELESFSHTVSHDLRHPLRIVDGFARILQEDYSQLFDRTGNEHLNRILSASHRMNAMIDALVELHGISSQTIAADPVDLSALARSITDELTTSNPSRDLEITIEAGMSCRGDRVLLRMALFNLIENAWKYSSRTEQASIHIDTVALHDTRVYRVTDNGAGFDMRFADRLFSLFHRLHGQAEFKGTGVGLAAVQRIIRRHGGRIWAESSPGEGASFQFTLWDDSEPENTDPIETPTETPNQRSS